MRLFGIDNLYVYYYKSAVWKFWENDALILTDSIVSIRECELLYENFCPYFIRKNPWNYISCNWENTRVC